MVPAPRPTSSARGAGNELLLLRPGAAADLQRSLALLAGTAFALVLSPPRALESGGEEEWAARLARASSAPHELLSELARPSAGESDLALSRRVWPALEGAFGRGRILALVSYDVLRVSVACALGLELLRSTALRVDPGRMVLLRDDPIGLVLRHSNVLAPAASSGTPLPGGRPRSTG